MITLASYNKFSNNILRDTFIISIGNCLTSIFAGFAIFSGIGFIAKQLGKSIDDVIEGGPGLAFVVYPEAISRMSISPLWAVLFFLMLITLGLDSMIILLATFIKYEPFKSGSYEYPLWANIFGWIISFAPMLIIVFFIIKRLYDYRHLSLRERLRVLTTPTEEWYKNSKAFEYDNMQKNLHLTGHVNPYGHAQ
ncbi:Sodium- and chloride-dependent glycine transporter 2 [Nymphon striatum]|nr:Sodium- and chloride-dependent glycine transporter 2 [Nymphon striatum]